MLDLKTGWSGRWVTGCQIGFYWVGEIREKKDEGVEEDR